MRKQSVLNELVMQVDTLTDAMLLYAQGEQWQKLQDVEQHRVPGMMSLLRHLSNNALTLPQLQQVRDILRKNNIVIELCQRRYEQGMENSSIAIHKKNTLIKTYMKAG